MNARVGGLQWSSQHKAYRLHQDVSALYLRSVAFQASKVGDATVRSLTEWRHLQEREYNRKRLNWKGAVLAPPRGGFHGSMQLGRSFPKGRFLPPVYRMETTGISSEYHQKPESVFRQKTMEYMKSLYEDYTPPSTSQGRLPPIDLDKMKSNHGNEGAERLPVTPKTPSTIVDTDIKPVEMKDTIQVKVTSVSKTPD